jgi:single-strand DNA-binding protein
MKNKVNLIGRIGKEAELKVISDKFKVAKTTLATWVYKKSKDGDKYETVTTWHNIKAFNYDAEKLSKLAKASLIDIEGSIVIEEYEKDGIKKQVTIIQVDKLINLSAKKETTQQVETVEAEVMSSADSVLPF